MTSPFDRLEKMMNRSVDSTFGEAFVLTPMRAAPNSLARRDMDRNIVSGRGVFTDGPADNAGIQLGTKRSYGGRTNDLGILRAGRRLELSVEREVFGIEAPRSGDAVEIRDRRFDVIVIEVNQQSRITLQLSERSAT